jgi:hypothetical protein
MIINRHRRSIQHGQSESRIMSRWRAPAREPPGVFILTIRKSAFSWLPAGIWCGRAHRAHERGQGPKGGATPSFPMTHYAVQCSRSLPECEWPNQLGNPSFDDRTHNGEDAP